MSIWVLCEHNNLQGILKRGFQRDNIPLVRSRAESPCRVWDRVPQTAAGRSAKGELKNSPPDCFLRGNALQEGAFLYSILYKFTICGVTLKALCMALPHATPNALLLDYAKVLVNPF